MSKEMSEEMSKEMSEELRKETSKIMQPSANAGITIEVMKPVFSVCKVADYKGFDFDQPFVFTGCTDEEKSLVCPAELVPDNTTSRDDGWKAFRICGVLDFSLIGILAGIASVLAAERIGIFAVSTYNTDYILTKEENFEKAIQALKEAGYRILADDEDLK